MGAVRLFTRLKAFRDEHIKVDMVPLLFGIADVISDNVDTRINQIARVMDINDLPIRVIAINGTIFTRYDQKMVDQIADILDFEHLQEQSAMLLNRLQETQLLISEKMSKFRPMKDMFITEAHKVSKFE